MQLVLYVVASVTSPLLIIHLLYGRPFLLGSKTMKVLNRSKTNTTDYKWCEQRLFLHFIAVSSIVMWLYALIMSMIGLGYQQQELERDLMTIHKKEHEGFNLMYGLTPLIFAENVLTLCVSLTVYFIALKKYWSKGQKSNKSSDMELQEQIKTSPNLSMDNSSQGSDTTSSTNNSESQISFDPRLAEYFFLSFPITTIAVHFTHIVIGFIQNPVHATSVGLFYSIVVLASVVLYKIISSVYLSCIEGKNIYESNFLVYEITFVTIISHILIVMVGLFGYVGSLYFLLPINRAVDIAPTVLNGFVSSVTLIYAGYIAYYFTRKRKEKKS